MAAQTLDPHHRQNLRWMLQVLGLSQIMPASLPSLGVAPGSQLSVQPSPLATVPYGDKSKPDQFMASRNEATVEAEIADYEVLAYGATLGLIYYRAIGDVARSAWDRQMQKTIDDARNQMQSVLDAGRTNWEKVRQSGGPTPAFRQAYQDLVVKKQALSRKLDFFVTLQGCKQSVFSGTRFVEFNDDSVVARTPWCQCDTEFRFAAWQILSGEAGGPPVFNRGWDKEQREKTLRQEIYDAYSTILKAKLTGYLDKFLELGEPLLRGALRDGFELIIRHIPVADLFVDLVEDKLAEMKLNSLIHQYRQDEQRRFFLKALDWGTYTRMDPVGTPAGGVPKGQPLHR